MNAQRKLKSAEFISEIDLKGIFKGIKSKAARNDQQVYVYSFLKKVSKRNVTNIDHSVNVVNKPAAEYKIKSKNNTSKGDFVKMWAVRTEGSTSNRIKSFSSKEEAMDYAAQLISKGKGSKVVAESK